MDPVSEYDTLIASSEKLVRRYISFGKHFEAKPSFQHKITSQATTFKRALEEFKSVCKDANQRYQELNLSMALNGFVEGVDDHINALWTDLDSLCMIVSDKRGDKYNRMSKQKLSEFLHYEERMKYHIEGLGAASMALKFLQRVVHSKGIAEVYNEILGLPTELQNIILSFSPNYLREGLESRMKSKDSGTFVHESQSHGGGDVVAEAKNRLEEASFTSGSTSIVDLKAQDGSDDSRRMLTTSLIHAVQENNTTQAITLINSGENLEITDCCQRTAVIVATITGNVPILRLLLEKGANVSARDDAHRTALHYAVTMPNHDCLNVLLAYNADITLRDFRKETPWIRAIRYGYGVIVQLLLDRHPDLENNRDEMNRTALHLAVTIDRDDVLSPLLDYAQRITHHEVCVASKSNNHEIYDCSAPIPQLDLVDDFQRTPLQYAIGSNSHSAVKQLLKRCPNGASSPLTPKWKDKWTNCQNLMASPPSRVKVQWARPIHHAISSEDQELLDILLDFHADIELEDSAQWTPLSLAILSENLEATRKLLEHGAAFSKPYSGDSTITTLSAAVEEFSVDILDSAEAPHVLESPGSPDFNCLLEEARKAGERTDVKDVRENWKFMYLVVKMSSLVSPRNEQVKDPEIEVKVSEVEEIQSEELNNDSPPEKNIPFVLEFGKIRYLDHPSD